MTTGRISLIESLAGRARARTAQTLAPTRVRAIHIPDDFVKRICQSQDSDVERARIGGDYLHVSALIGICQRQHILAARQEQAVLRAVTGGHRVMWAIGRAVEKHVRGQVIAGARGMVFGKWACACGATVHTGHYPQHRCARCGTALNTYEEFTQLYEPGRLMGNPDLLMRFHERLAVVEVKSMNSKDFDALKSPLGDHVFQALMYRRMLAENGHPVHDHVIIFYVTKDFKWGSPYKEFKVLATEPARVSECDRALETARQLKEYREANVGLPPRECAQPTLSRAKACPLVGMCFSSNQ